MMFILALIAGLFTSCTAPVRVVHIPKGSINYNGQYGQAGEDYASAQPTAWSPNPNRPIGVLHKTTESGTETFHGDVKGMIEADAPPEMREQAMVQLKAWLEGEYNSRHEWPSQVDAERQVEKIFASLGRPLKAVREKVGNGQRGCFMLTRYFVQSSIPAETTKKANAPVTTETPILRESDIPVGATRSPAIRGPEQYQPPAQFRRKTTTTSASEASVQETTSTTEPELPQ